MVRPRRVVNQRLARAPRRRFSTASSISRAFRFDSAANADAANLLHARRHRRARAFDAPARDASPRRSAPPRRRRARHRVAARHRARAALPSRRRVAGIRRRVRVGTDALANASRAERARRLGIARSRASSDLAPRPSSASLARARSDDVSIDDDVPGVGDAMRARTAHRGRASRANDDVQRTAARCRRNARRGRATRREDAMDGGGRGARAASDKANATASDAEPVKLLTSDESENLLKIRHTVRRKREAWGDSRSAVDRTTTREGRAEGVCARPEPRGDEWRLTMGSLILRFAERARDGDGGAKGVSERAVHDRAVDRPRDFITTFTTQRASPNQDMKNIQKEMYKIIRKDYPLRDARKSLARRSRDAASGRLTSRTSSRSSTPSRRNQSQSTTSATSGGTSAPDRTSSPPRKSTQSHRPRVRRGRLLEGRREAADAPAHLRHGLGITRGAQGVQRVQG